MRGGTLARRADAVPGLRDRPFGRGQCDRISQCVRRRQLLTMAHPVRRDDVKTFV